MSGTNPLSHAGTQNTTGRFSFWTIFPMNNEKVMGLSTWRQIECMSTRNVELSVKFSTLECQLNMEKEKLIFSTTGIFLVIPKHKQQEFVHLAALLLYLCVLGAGSKY